MNAEFSGYGTGAGGYHGTPNAEETIEALRRRNHELITDLAEMRRRKEQWERLYDDAARNLKLVKEELAESQAIRQKWAGLLATIQNEIDPGTI